jgi:hypothetical protein
VSSEIATTIRRRVVRRPTRQPRTGTAVRRQRRALAVQLLGPLTMVSGVIWAIAQPYRIAFLYPDGKGFYDFVAQPPLLVVLVGVAYLLLIAPGLVEDLEQERHLEQEEHGPES